MPYKDLEKRKEWVKRHRESINKTQRKYVEKNKDKIRERNIKRSYDITLEDYNELFFNQHGCCAICGTHQIDFKRQLFLDHCHTTGKIRGLLCQHCNFILGQAKDSIIILQKAINYLNKD
ncbi:MAG: endonuclease VII domain-containing protein [archaeon]|nr:endonuclease VII domain-containing protein [archaeon]